MFYFSAIPGLVSTHDGKGERETYGRCRARACRCSGERSGTPV
jgi:hypothetical protein